MGCCCFCALGARCFSRGPSATVRRGRQGRAAGKPMDGLAFSRGQEPARKARPRLTDSQGRACPGLDPGMPGERRRGVPFLFGSFLFGHAKRKELGRRQALETASSLAITQKQAPLSRRERDSPTSTFPNSSRSASLSKARACGAWSLRTGTSNIPDTSALDQPSAVEKRLAGMTSKIRASLRRAAASGRTSRRPAPSPFPVRRVPRTDGSHGAPAPSSRGSSTPPAPRG